jgi:hypothetical protein
MKVCTLESQDLMALIRQVPSKPLISNFFFVTKPNA